MRASVQAEGASFLDMHALVCPGLDRCRVLGESGRPLFSDAVHTTRTGNREFGRLLRIDPSAGGRVALVRSQRPAAR